jgi:hypothetical protein
MYWVDIFAGDIRRANLDGTGQQTLLTGLDRPFSIALDVAHGTMYWSGVFAEIGRANLDGTGEETLYTTSTDSLNGLALDLVNDKMYWAEYGNGFPNTGQIKRANLDGTGQETLFTGLDEPVAIALQVGPVPEPSTLLLLAIGTLGVIGWAWRQAMRDFADER